MTTREMMKLAGAGLVGGLLTVSCGGGGNPAGVATDGGAAPAAEGKTASENRRPLTVGFAQAGAESAWRVAETQSIKGEAEARGVELKFADARGKQEDQIASVRRFIEEGVDAVVVSPVGESGWEDVFKDAKGAGIPVVVVGRGVEASGDLYATLIASDFVLQGNLAGEWMANESAEEAKIIELCGSPGSALAIGRKKGFEEAIKEFPEMEIIASQPGDFDLEKGKEVMGALLEQHKDEVTAVYAHNDDMARGAIQAMEEVGLEPGEEIIVVSIDGTKGGFDAMLGQKLNCTVEWNPLVGPQVFDAVEKAVAGEEVEKWVVVEDRVFDLAAALEERANRKY